MADRVGQAFAWPVPSDAGLLPPHGPPPLPCSNGGRRLLNRLRSIRKMRYPFFTRELRLGLQVLLSTSDLEVRHG